MKPISCEFLPNQLVRLLNRPPEFSASESGLGWGMAPELAYGRHRGPARIRSRQAAVAVVLTPDKAGDWIIPLTRRPTALRHHGGQICFPGGRIEAGETPQQAALREFEEELGVRPDIVAYCGQLPSQYVYASDNQVTPVIFVARQQGRTWSPDPSEVDEVLELPLSAIMRDRNIRRINQCRSIRKAKSMNSPASSCGRDDGSAGKITHFDAANVASLDFKAPAFMYQDWQIWGATAVILDQLAQCLRRSMPDKSDAFDSANLASSGI
ncbi:NUDIX hydrolase [Neorhodopirellula pilleata]|uniref:8-oxo-dGTP diphosphatase n=1 Tax=Neorhodopirellula pilleata TaxID=2714738 RepID=A0A5C5ZZW0_9BACT|nr:CoA pyrophosphatase [Neorhodopirellula pilleata]TWT92600.1 8-oxo-dGTP diphosphatase [Neorhodopirellula pilleata]